MIHFHYMHVTAEPNRNQQPSDFGAKRLPMSNTAERGHGKSASEMNCGATVKVCAASSGVLRVMSDRI
jgi:hypothetical protein